MTWGFNTCGPNEVLVVSGCFLPHPAYISGGRKFVWPGLQQAQRISLNTHTLLIETNRIYTQLGVPISVTGVAQVKIQGSNSDMLMAACEQFLGKSDKQISEVAKSTLEGHQRAIMGNMTVEEIYKDRKKFSQAVFEVASSDLVRMGIAVVSYTLKDVKDDEGYLHSLGLTRTAQVKSDARKGEAEARRDAGIKEARAEQERLAARLTNDELIAQARRDYELKKSAYDQEVQAKKAQSEMAYQLQAAKTRQRIREEEMQIKVIERTQVIQVQDLEITRRERELDATVRKPAEADQYRIEKLAEAEKQARVKEAQAQAESIRLKGEAEAFALHAKAKAETEQMMLKAAALKEYQGAAKMDMILKALPQIAAEVAQPFAQVKKITMISSGGEHSSVGAAKLTGEVFDIMERLPEMMKRMTGVDVVKEMQIR